MFIAADQEGGRVTRLTSGTQFAGNMALGATGNTDYAYDTGKIIGEELQALGINTDFAPVVDVNNNPSNPVIGTRSFSDDTQTVSDLGTAFMNGLKSTDTISTLKHFPGHGNTDTDSHTGLPRIDATYDELKQCELVPFEECIDGGAEMIMTAHIQYPNIEKNTYKSILDNEDIYLPATLSKTILTDILRGDMGYDGVIVTDAMEMDAINKHFDKLDAMKLAINAGVDILLGPGDIVTDADAAEFEQLFSQLVAAADSDEALMSNINASVRRILTLKQEKGLLDAYDSSDLDERILNAKAIVGSQAHHNKEWEITKRAITLVRNEYDTLPLNRKNEKTVILTAYPDEITSMTYAKELIIDENKLPDGGMIDINSFRKTENGKTVLKTADEIKELARDADNVIAVTELGSAGGLKPANTSNAAAAQSALIDELIPFIHTSGGRFILLSCNLPYDSARYPDADAVLLAWSPKGMSENPNYRGVADLARQIHETEDNKKVFPNAALRLTEWVDRAFDEGDKTAAALKGMVEAIPETSNLIHGDFHTGNVFLVNGEPLFIDVDRMSMGNPIIDISGVYLFYVGYGELDKKMVEDFMGFPYETAHAFYNSFIRNYLDTNDENKLRTVTQKAQTLAYVRLIGQIKKKKTLSDKDKKTIENLTDKIKELIRLQTSLEI